MIDRVGRTVEEYFTGITGTFINIFLALSLQLLWKMLGTI
jgi:hypothetical protein